MARLMPQEIEVWYLLPAVRKALAGIFIKDFKLKQKEAASLLGLTESAISQYLKSKRAHELELGKEDLALIKKAAHQMVEDKEHVMEQLYALCRALRGCESMCKLHKKLDPSIKGDCRLCAWNRLGQ